jgi:hypothetical protein
MAKNELITVIKRCDHNAGVMNRYINTVYEAEADISECIMNTIIDKFKPI